MIGRQPPPRRTRLMRVRVASLALLFGIGLGTCAAVVHAWRLAVVLLIVTLIALVIAVDQLRTIATEDGGPIS